MFSKSKRFDDKVPVGPPVGAYDVTMHLQGSTGAATFDRSLRWGKESSSSSKENLNATVDESYLRATPQKELFSSARKPVASVSRMPAALDRASAAKLKEVELELSRLRQERMSLLQKVGVAQEEATRAEQQLVSCRRDKVSLESRLASLQKERKGLVASVTKLEGMVAKQESSKQTSGKVHAEATNLRHQLEVTQSELVTARQEWEAASRKAREEKRGLESTIASLSEQLAAKEVDFVLFSARTKEECDCRLTMMQKCMDTMSSEFEAKYSRLDTVHQFEKEACEQQVSSLTEELQAEKCRVGDLVTEVQSLRTQLSAAGERENVLMDKCKQKETECASLTEELKNQNDMNMQALQSMTAKCMEIEDELDHERKSYKQTQAVVKAELSSTQAALNAMTVENASLRGAYQDLQRRLSASELANARLEAELEVALHTAESKEQAAMERLSRAAADADDLRTRLGVSEDEVRVLQGERLTLEELVKTKCSELERVLGESREAEARLLQDVVVKDGKVEKMHGVILELTEQVRGKEERISHLLRDLQEEKESSRKQAKQLESSKQRINVCDERLVLRLKEDIDVLKRENEELSSDATKWKMEFHELQSKYSPYQAQIDQLVSRIQGLQSQSDLAESEAVRMGKQFAQLVGHTNHRQKIQYVQKLTNENLSLKKEVMHLRDEEMKAKRKLRALEDDLSRLGEERRPLATRNC